MTAQDAWKAILATPYHYVTEAQVAMLKADAVLRLTPLLVRCGRCRFTAPAQDVDGLIRAVEAAGDFVRDVSLARS